MKIKLKLKEKPLDSGSVRNNGYQIFEERVRLIRLNGGTTMVTAVARLGFSTCIENILVSNSGSLSKKIAMKESLNTLDIYLDNGNLICVLGNGKPLYGLTSSSLEPTKVLEGEIGCIKLHRLHPQRGGYGVTKGRLYLRLKVDQKGLRVKIVYTNTNYRPDSQFKSGVILDEYVLNNLEAAMLQNHILDISKTEKSC